MMWASTLFFRFTFTVPNEPAGACEKTIPRGDAFPHLPMEWRLIDLVEEW